MQMVRRVLVAGALMVGAAQAAQAELIRFVNDGTFSWYDSHAPFTCGRPLDVTQGPGQSPQPNDRSIWYFAGTHFSSTQVVPDYIADYSCGPRSQSAVAQSTTAVVIH